MMDTEANGNDNNNGTLMEEEAGHLESPGNQLLYNDDKTNEANGINNGTTMEGETDHLQTPGNQLIYNQMDNEDMANMDIVATPETQPFKRRRKKSEVWDHFHIEHVNSECRRAICDQCNQSFAYSIGSKVAGTSHLKRHIAKGTCSAILRNQLIYGTPTTKADNAAADPPKRRNKSVNVFLDQDRSRHEIAKMIIMHEYPLHMVETPGFSSFVENIQPRFAALSFNTVQGDCVATFLREKFNLMKYVEGIPGRVCLTLDMLTSTQTLGYVFITAHFIDSEWKYQKRLLNVVMEPFPESDSAFSHAVAIGLSDWNLEGKLFSVTLNQPLSEAAMNNLRPLLSAKNPAILNGQLLTIKCIAHTYRDIAKDLFVAGSDIIKKVRESVKFVKLSDSHEENFLELKQTLQIPSEKTLSMDDQTRWDTTYQMLLAACELKEVFSCLDDPDYTEPPTMADWKQAETICAFLKLICDSANILKTATSPTATTFFHEVWKIHSELTRSIASEDPYISNLAKIMQQQVANYWKDCSLILALAVIMDPRFKMKLVEFSFSKFYGEEGPTYVKIVDDDIHELFHEYTVTSTIGEEGSNGKLEEPREGTLMSDYGLTDFDVYIMKTTNQHTKSELDLYLEESLLPRVQDFDAMGWWKNNKIRYPILSKMARDILSVPVCTVGADSIFGIGEKELDGYRSSLRPETVEALVCAKDWLQHGVEMSSALVKVDF